MKAQASPAPAKAKSLGNALEKLGHKIASGELLPGEQIRQQEMAEQLGISRVPLREALNVLADQGLLTHQPNKGYFVIKRPLSELRQIARMLDALEDELFSSVTWPDEAGLAALEALNARMKACVDSDDWTPLIALNRAFHWQVYGLSPHHLIQDELRRLWAMVDPYLATKMSDRQARQLTVREHEAIIDAVRAGDHRRFVETVRSHRHSAAQGMQGVNVG